MTESAPNPIRATLPARMPRVTPMIASSDVQAMLKYSTRRPARVQRTRSGPAALITASGIRVILQLSGHSALENFNAEQPEKRTEGAGQNQTADQLKNNCVPTERFCRLLGHLHFHNVNCGGTGKGRKDC